MTIQRVASAAILIQVALIGSNALARGVVESTSCSKGAQSIDREYHSDLNTGKWTFNSCVAIIAGRASKPLVLAATESSCDASLCEAPEVIAITQEITLAEVRAELKSEVSSIYLSLGIDAKGQKEIIDGANRVFESALKNGQDVTTAKTAALSMAERLANIINGRNEQHNTIVQTMIANGKTKAERDRITAKADQVYDDAIRRGASIEEAKAAALNTLP